mgnify:CR=1 FL=1
MKNNLIKPLSLIMATLFISPIVIGIEKEKDLLIEEIIRGEPVERINPIYPRDAARRGQEGWVIVSYVIGKDGKVNSAVVDESSNGKVFNRATLRAIKQWEFEPTTVNGKAIEQCKNNVRMEFTLGSDNKGARRTFIRKYNDAVEFIDNKSYPEARELIDKLHKGGSWNLYEDAWLLSLEAEYYRNTGELNEEYDALTSLSYGKTDYLGKSQTLRALVRLFQLTVDKKYYKSALRAARLVKKIDDEKLVFTKLVNTVNQIERFLIEGGNYLVNGTLESGVWNYYLARNSFSFSGDTSHLRKLDIRCDNKYLTYKVEDKSVWNIPESYGSCAIYVYGEEDSTVKLIEVAKNA